MFGAGFGGGGETYYTTMALLGLGGYVTGLHQAAGGWRALEAAQRSASNAPGIKMQAAGGAMIGFAATASRSLVSLAKDALGFNNQMELIKVGFTTMLGSASAATAKIKELQTFAAKTQFNFGESAKAAQTLLAMGISGQRLIPIMRAVGNAVSAAGGGTPQFLGALMAIGKIQSSGVLSSVRLNQLAARGIPAAKILREQLGLTAKQMQNIGREKIPAERAINALVTGFNRKFAGSLDKGSQTTPGKISNAEDAIERAKTLIGSDIAGDVGKAAVAVTHLIEKFEKLSPTIRKAIVYGAGIATIGVGVAGVGLVIAGTFANIRAASSLAALSTRGLSAAVKEDIAVERAKIPVARAHAAGLGGVGRAARGAAAAEATMAGASYGTATAWGAPAAALGAGYGARALGAGAGRMGATEILPKMLPAAGGSFGGAEVLNTTSRLGMYSRFGVAGLAGAGVGYGLWRAGKSTGLIGEDTNYGFNIPSAIVTGAGGYAAHRTYGALPGLAARGADAYGAFGRSAAGGILKSGMSPGTKVGLLRALGADSVGTAVEGLAARRLSATAASRLGGLAGRGVMAATGRALPAAGLGYMAGRGINMDLQKAGMNKFAAENYGAAGGAGIAALGMWNPATMVGAAGGLLIRHGVNRYYNDVMERSNAGIYYDEAGNQTRESINPRAGIPRVNEAAIRLSGQTVMARDYGAEAEAREAQAAELSRRSQEIGRRNASGGTKSWRRLANFFTNGGDWNLADKMADDQVREWWDWNAEAESLRRSSNVQMRHAREARAREAQLALNERNQAEIRASTNRNHAMGTASFYYDKDGQVVQDASWRSPEAENRRRYSSGYYATLRQFGIRGVGDERAALINRNTRKDTSTPDTKHARDTWGEFVGYSGGTAPNKPLAGRVVTRRDDSKQIIINIPAGADSDMMREAIHATMSPSNMRGF